MGSAPARAASAGEAPASLPAGIRLRGRAPLEILIGFRRAGAGGRRGRIGRAVLPTASACAGSGRGHLPRLAVARAYAELLLELQVRETPHRLRSHRGLRRLLEEAPVAAASPDRGPARPSPPARPGARCAAPPASPSSPVARAAQPATSSRREHASEWRGGASACPPRRTGRARRDRSCRRRA